MKTIRAKYQIKPNIYVSCYLEVEDVSEKHLRCVVGVKQRADSKVPIGTKLFLDPGAVSSKAKKDELGARAEEGAFEEAWVKVLSHNEDGKEVMHFCTPLERHWRENQRKAERVETNFMASFGEGVLLKVDNASTQGLGMVVQSARMMTTLNLDCDYDFAIERKEKKHIFPATIRHIQYNWKTMNHRLGVALKPMDEDLEIVLKMLIDPEFEITLKSKVDTGEGKITSQD